MMVVNRHLWEENELEDWNQKVIFRFSTNLADT